MKITKEQLNQLIKEELDAVINEDEYDPRPDPDRVSDEEATRFMAALREIENSDLSESTKDAVYDMMHRIGIHL